MPPLTSLTHRAGWGFGLAGVHCSHTGENPVYGIGGRSGLNRLSRKRVLNLVKNIVRDSWARIARCFRRPGNDLPNLWRASACRADHRTIGAMRGQPVAGLFLALVSNGAG